MTHTSTTWPLALACTAVFSGICAADDQGFLEDSHLTLLNRLNVMHHRIPGDGHDQRPNNRRDPKDVTLGERLNFTSGFTQGTVGLGVDAFGQSGSRCDLYRHHGIDAAAIRAAALALLGG